MELIENTQKREMSKRETLNEEMTGIKNVYFDWLCVYFDWLRVYFDWLCVCLDF